VARGLDRFGRSPIEPPSESWGLSLLLAFIFTLCLALVGALDFQDELLEADHYCRMVHQKLWVDYQKTYDKECKHGRFVGTL
jgi:hypothetical protein